MIIKKIKISDINPAPYNPRADLKPSDLEYKKLKKSIDEFDLVEPLILNERNNVLIGGHQRLKILKERGDETVDVSLMDLDEAKEKALNVALNKNLGQWDNKKLNLIFEELKGIDDFDIELTGFDDFEIDKIDHDIEVHESRYKPGEGSITSNVELIYDEIVAMTTNDECIDLFGNKKQIYISYSGGKDSTFALVWAKQNFPDKEITAVFSDTGVEFPGFVAHIKESCDYMDVKYQIVKPEKDMWIQILKQGWPNIINRWCQKMFIYDPINTLYKSLPPEDIIILDGSRSDQVNRTTRKTKTSKPADKTMLKYNFYHPAFDVKKEVLEDVLKKSGVPIWSGYDRGFLRTACWMCPGQSGSQAYALSQNYPGLVDVIRNWEHKIGQKLQNSNNRTIDDLINTGKRKHDKQIE